MSKSTTIKLGILCSRIRYEEKLLIEEAKKRSDIALSMVKSNDLILDGSPQLDLDVLLDREISQSRALHTVQHFQSAGVECVNQYDVIRVCGDKAFTSKILKNKGVKTPAVRVAFTKESALAAIEELGYPAVLKPVDGSWGRLMALIENRTAAEAIFEHKSYLSSYFHSIYYLQEFVQKPDRDIRAFVLGDETICAVYRMSENWRTNTAQGAETKICPVTPELDDICRLAAQAVGGGALAIDLMETPDGLTVHEINCAMEFKGSLRVSKVNIPARIIDYCVEKIMKKKEQN